MKYVIMADGKGSRWNNYMGLTKHNIRIGGETLLERTVRLLHEYDDAAEVIITSHNTQLHIDGAERYEPKNNVRSTASRQSLSAIICAFSTAMCTTPRKR